MEIIAKSKFIRASSRKLQLVAKLLPGLSAQKAVDLLEHMNIRAADSMVRVIKQGLGNAANNFNLDKKSLLIKTVEVGKGPIIKRARFVSRGRVHSIHKPTAHIRMVLDAKVVKEEMKKVEPKIKKEVVKKSK